MNLSRRLTLFLLALVLLSGPSALLGQTEAIVQSIVDQSNTIDSRLARMTKLEVDASHADSNYGLGTVSVWTEGGFVSKVRNEIHSQDSVNIQEAWLQNGEPIFFFDRSEWYGTQDGTVSLNEYRYYLHNQEVIREMGRSASRPKGGSLDLTGVADVVNDDFDPEYGRGLFDDRKLQTDEIIKTVQALTSQGGPSPDLLRWPYRVMLHTLSEGGRYAAAWGIESVPQPDWIRWETERYDYLTSIGDPALTLHLVDLTTGNSLGRIESEFEPGGSAPYFWMKWAPGDRFFLAGCDFRRATGSTSLYRVNGPQLVKTSDLYSDLSRFAMNALREADHPYAIDATDAMGFLDLKTLSPDGSISLTYAIESNFEGTRRNASVDLTVKANLATGETVLLSSLVAPFEPFPTSWQKFGATLAASANQWIQTPPAIVDYLGFETFIEDGVHHLYNLFGGFLNPDLVEVLIQRPLFVSGPHYPGGLVTTARFDFGRYDPEAIRAISNEMDRLLSPEIVSSTQGLYRAELGAMAKHFQEALQYWEANPEELERQKTVYLNHLKNETLPEFYYLLDGDLADQLMDSYSDNWDDRTCYLTALRFWLRRSCDGSYEEFASLLQKVVSTYDPAYFAYRGLPNLKLEAPTATSGGSLSDLIMDESGVLGVNHLTPFDFPTLQSRFSGFSVSQTEFFDPGGQYPAFLVQQGNKEVLTLIRYDSGDPLAFELRSWNMKLANGVATGDRFADVFAEQRPLGLFNGLETDIGAVMVEAPGSERITLMFQPAPGSILNDHTLTRSDLADFILTEMRWMP